MPSIDLTSLASVVFDGKEVQVLQLNGQTIWEFATDDLSFNYTGLDANGNMEGQLAFDGTIVAYAIGKPVITITTADDGTQTESISYPETSAFNSDYYGGYDFQTAIRTDSLESYTQIIPDDIILPNSYKGKPVVSILTSAFDCGLTQLSGGASYTEVTQAYFIKSVTFSDNLKEIQSKGFHWLRELTKDIQLNDGLETLASYAISGCNLPSKKLVIPSTVVNFGANSLVYGLSSLRDTTIVLKTPVLEFTSTSSFLDDNKSLVFENSVHSITGCIGYSVVAFNFIFNHSNSDTISLNLSSAKGATEVNIYTDNDYIKNYDWASKNYTATFYSLSDYME